MVKINLLERYFNRNSLSQPNWSLKSASDGVNNISRQPQSGHSSVSNYSPQDIANNDFFYDDEFSVQFDANLNKFDNELQSSDLGLPSLGLPSLECRESNDGVGLTDRVLQLETSTFDFSQSSSNSLELSDQSWLAAAGNCNDDNSDGESLASSALLDSSSCQLNPVIAAWGTFRDLSNLTALSPADSLIESSQEDSQQGLDSDGDDIDIPGHKVPADRQNLVSWGRRHSKMSPNLLESSRPCLALTDWVKASTDDKAENGGTSNAAKLVTWRTVKSSDHLKNAVTVDPARPPLTTWQNLKTSDGCPSDSAFCNERRVSISSESADKPADNKMHSGPLLDFFTRTRYSVGSAERLCDFGQCCDGSFNGNLLVFGDFSSPDQEFFLCPKSASVDNFCTPFSDVHEKLFLELQSTSPGKTDSFSYPALKPDEKYPHLLSISARSNSISSKLDAFLTTENTMKPTSLSPFGSQTLPDVEVDNHIRLSKASKLDSETQTLTESIEVSPKRQRRNIFAKPLPDLGFLRSGIPQSHASPASTLSTSCTLSEQSNSECLGLAESLSTSLDFQLSVCSAVDSLCFSTTSSHTSSMVASMSLSDGLETSDLQSISPESNGDTEEDTSCTLPISGNLLSFGEDTNNAEFEKSVETDTSIPGNKCSPEIEPSCGDLVTSCGKMCNICRPFSACQADIPCVHDSPEEFQDIGCPVFPIPKTTSESMEISQQHLERPGKSILARRGVELTMLQCQNNRSSENKLASSLSLSLPANSSAVAPSGECQQRTSQSMCCCGADRVTYLTEASDKVSPDCPGEHTKTVSFSDAENVVYCFTPENTLSSPNFLTDDLGYHSMVGLTVGAESETSYAAAADVNVSDDDSELPPTDFPVAAVSPPQTVSLSASVAVMHVAASAVDLSHAQELVGDVSRAVHLLVTHFSQAKNSVHRETLGNTCINADIGQLVVRHLCPAIHAVLLDGLKPHLTTLFGKIRNSAWKVLEDSIKTDSVYCDLLNEVRSHHGMKNSHWMRFNAFIFALLNHKAVDIWLLHLHSQKSLLSYHYTPIAFLRLGSPGSPGRQLFMRLVAVTRSLARLPFHVELDYEFRRLQQRQQNRVAVSRESSLTQSLAAWQHYSNNAALLAQSTAFNLGNKASESIYWAKKLASSAIVDLESYRFGSFARPSSVTDNANVLDVSRQSADSGFEIAADGGFENDRQRIENRIESENGADVGLIGSRCENIAIRDSGFESIATEQVDSGGFESILDMNLEHYDSSPCLMPTKLAPKKFPKVSVQNTAEADKKTNILSKPSAGVSELINIHTMPDVVIGCNDRTETSGNCGRDIEQHEQVEEVDLIDFSTSVVQVSYADAENINEEIPVKENRGPSSTVEARPSGGRWSGFGTRILGLVDKVLLSNPADYYRKLVPRCQQQSVHQPQECEQFVHGSQDGTLASRAAAAEEKSRAQDNGMQLDYQQKEVKVSYLQALCHYVATDASELSFAKGDQLELVHQTIDADWLLCRHGDHEGLVHSACVQYC